MRDKRPLKKYPHFFVPHPVDARYCLYCDKPEKHQRHNMKDRESNP